MNDTEFFDRLLGLKPPWKVDRIELDILSESVNVYLTYSSRAAFECPVCKKRAPKYDVRNVRKWRHLDTLQLKTYLVASVPRIECGTHGVQTVEVPWSEPHSRFTLILECHAIRVLQATRVQSKAGQLLRLSPSQIHDIMQRAVERGLQLRNQSEILTNLSLDEKSFQKGHYYVTVLGDTTQKRVLDITEDRTLEATVSLLRDTLSQSQIEGVKSVSMDMWTAFMSARAEVLPEADTVHDRFHMSGYLNKAVDNTRRDEFRSQQKTGNDQLSKTKYLWLKSDINLTDKQKAALEGLKGLQLDTAKVWAFKEKFRDFFDCKDVHEGESFINQWCEASVAIRNKHLTKVSAMILKHKEGLLAYIKHKVTNATAESLNAFLVCVDLANHSPRSSSVWIWQITARVPRL